MLASLNSPNQLFRMTEELRFRGQRAVSRTGGERGRSEHGMELDGGHIHFEEWKRRQEFSSSVYDFKGEHVVHRGVCFKTGDILLCNRARGSDGMFTTLVDGRQTFAHVAVFALLDCDGELFPSVLEIHHEGVRAVPLKAFVGPAFSTYIETYRSRSVSSDARKRLSSAGRAMLREPHGFDIDMDESQDVYLSCALMAARLYERAGLARITGKSRYSRSTYPNLQILGNVSSANRDLLMPDDYSRSEEFALAGIVDNGCFIDLVARALVRERMQEIWRTKTLDPGLFPVQYSINRVAVNCIQNRVWGLDQVLAKLAGFTLASFPSGPATFIALTPVVETRIDRAASLVSEGLAEFHDVLMGSNSFDEIIAMPGIRDLVSRAMESFESLFVDRL